MNRDGIYPDDNDNTRADAAEQRTLQLLEAADACLLGQQVTGGDPPDGVVVEVVSC